MQLLSYHSVSTYLLLRRSYYSPYYAAISLNVFLHSSDETDSPNRWILIYHPHCFETSQSFPPEPLPSTPSFLPSPDTSFRHYALKLGYPDGIITRVLADLGADAGKEELISHLVKLQDMLCPRDSSQRRRRDATHLPSYMLVQDSYYKGKERMPFWVWVKRETIAVDVTGDPPHRRTGNQTRSRSSVLAVPLEQSTCF